MSIDNGRQLDLAAVNGLLEYRSDPILRLNPISTWTDLHTIFWTKRQELLHSVASRLAGRGQRKDLLIRVCRVDHDGLSSLFVLENVGIVVGLAHPCHAATVLVSSSSSRPTKKYGCVRGVLPRLGRYIHMGIDWMCIVRDEMLEN